jgi:FkbM family methyltransferase
MPAFSIIQVLEVFTQKLNKKFLMGELYFKIKPGDTILDIGACTGDMALYYSWKVGPTGKVYAIEPDRKLNLKKIMHTVKDAGNVYVCNCAITKTTGESQLYLSKDSSHHTMKKEFLWSQEPTERLELTVNTFTLDDFVKENKIEKIDTIYMNIEGSELDVLESGINTITTLSPKIYIAPHEVDGINLNTQAISKLESYGYKVIEYNGLIYASKHPEDFDMQEQTTCHQCGKPLNRFEDLRFDGTCWNCYSTFIQFWISKILGF